MSRMPGFYLRNLDEPDAKPIPGTTRTLRHPSFPGRSLGRFWSSDDALKKIRLAGGTPVTLTKAGNPLGVSWGVDDRIVYALSDGIWSVSGNGGAPEHLVKTTPESASTPRRCCQEAKRCCLRQRLRPLPKAGRRPHRRAGAR
jgi:hypothetical protein